MKSTLASLFLSTVVLALGLAPGASASADPKDIILVLDNSGSMKKNDPEFLTGIAVRAFLDGLEGDNRVAVLLFDEDVRMVMPLTLLNESTRADFLLSLERVNYKGQFTDSPAAIERAIYELKVNGRPDADKSIVFMTDGIVDTGNRAMDAEKSGWLRNDLAAEAADEGIRIFGIAFTENADFLLIQSLSKRTAGEYFRAYSPADIEGVFRRVIDVLETPEKPVLAQPVPAPEPFIELPALGPLSPDPLADADPSEPSAAAPSPAEVELPSLPGISDPVAAPLPSLPETDSGEAPLAERTTTERVAAPPAQAPAGGATPLAQRAPVSAIFLPLPMLIGFGVAIIALLVIVIVLLRRRSGVQAAPLEQIPKAFLNDLGGVTDNSSYELGNQLTVIGRLKGSEPDSVNYIVISEPTIGRRHAMIEFKDHSFWVIDQSSLNGTFVNNKRIESETRLKHGDRVRFHKHEFEFLLLDMFETDRTMMGQTVFSDMSRNIDNEDITQQMGPTGLEKTGVDQGGD